MFTFQCKIFTIKQKEGESTNDYIQRALADMTRYTGVTDIKDNLHHRELAVSVLMTGFAEVLRQRLQMSEPDWQDLSVTDFRKLAVSHEKNIVRKKERQTEELMTLRIQALQTKQYNTHHGSYSDDRNCFHCGKKGHIARTCNKKDFPSPPWRSYQPNDTYRRNGKQDRSRDEQINAAVTQALRQQAAESQCQ